MPKKKKNVQNFVNLMFHFEMIPTINKPMRVTRQTASAIDHIIKSIMHTEFKSEIIKLSSPTIFQFSFVISMLPKRKMLRMNL